MTTEELLKDSLSFSMSINNSKLSSLFRDGNLASSDEQMKRGFSSLTSFPPESSLLQVSSSNSSFFPNLSHISGIRSHLSNFNQTINLYGLPGIAGCSSINPYLLESIGTLQNLGTSQKSQISSRIIHVPGHPDNLVEISSHPRRKNATRETTSILKTWLNEHRKNPYPTKGEKIMLAVITKMTLTQVSTWFANARRRLKKENKMTWSPNHKSDDDLDDTDSSDNPSKSKENSDFLLKSHSKVLQKDLLSKLSNLDHLAVKNSEPKLSADLLKLTKPKIWSIADITSESSEPEPDTCIMSNISSQDNSSSMSKSLINSSALQYLLLKNRELYQFPLSNLFNKSNTLPLDFINLKNPICTDFNISQTNSDPY